MSEFYNDIRTFLSVRVFMRLPGYNRALNTYWALHRRAWYALDCPPTLTEGVLRRIFGGRSHTR